jgi:hypothetical protein
VTVHWIPLAVVPCRDIRDAVAAVSDAVAHPDALTHRMLTRAHTARITNDPARLWLLYDGAAPAGWAGWAPHEPSCGWQSTTYLAPHLRGHRLLHQARCLQAHAVPLLPSAGPVISSIAVTNDRSLRASTRYAREHGWPERLTVVHEPHLQRNAWILTWPPAPVPHTCFPELHRPATAA